jgi:hypothetical protein
MSLIPSKTAVSPAEPLMAPLGVPLPQEQNGRSPLKAALLFMLLLAIPLVFRLLFKAGRN